MRQFGLRLEWLRVFVDVDGYFTKKRLTVEIIRNEAVRQGI